MYDHIAFYYRYLAYTLLKQDLDETAMEAYARALSYEDLMEYSYHGIHSR